MSRYPLDAARALELKRKMTWRQVGIALAKEEGRSIAYSENAVAGAVRALKRATQT